MQFCGILEMFWGCPTSADRSMLRCPMPTFHLRSNDPSLCKVEANVRGKLDNIPTQDAGAERGLLLQEFMEFSGDDIEIESTQMAFGR